MQSAALSDPLTTCPIEIGVLASHGLLVTVTAALPDLPLLVADIVTGPPAETPVTMPPADTVATAELLVAHTTA
jgi:hypothetical protein